MEVEFVCFLNVSVDFIIYFLGEICYNKIRLVRIRIIIDKRKE